MLFTSTADDSLHALWVLLCTTGLRIAEASGLEWQHVDLSSETLTVQQAIRHRQGKGLVFIEPKTGRSRRTVHLATGTVAVLRLHQDRQKLAWRAAGKPWDETALVFCTKTGRPLAPSNIRRALHRALTQAELPLIRVHDSRHTAATYLLSIGTHPKKVQELIGHSSIMLTMDTYSHVLPSMHLEIADQMDRLFEVSEDDEERDARENAGMPREGADS